MGTCKPPYEHWYAPNAGEYVAPPVSPCRTTMMGVSSFRVRSCAGGVESIPLMTPRPGH